MNQKHPFRFSIQLRRWPGGSTGAALGRVGRLAILSTLGLLLALSESPTATAGPTINSETMAKALPIKRGQLGAHPIVFEVADTPAARQTGLMHRASLPRDQGMLFQFDQPASTQCMWMKNTLIDLDVAFMDQDLRILNVETMKAGSTQIHCSASPALWALEMNRDWFAQRKIKPGQRLELRDAETQ